MHWRLLLKKFSPELVYIKGHKNTVADTLSRLPKQGDIVIDIEAEIAFVPKDKRIFQMHLQLIHNTQSKDRNLRKRLKDNHTNKKRKIIENTKVIIYKDGIFVLEKMRNQNLTWYHHYTYHLGRDGMYKIMSATLYWDEIDTDFAAFTKTCHTCQNLEKRK